MGVIEETRELLLSKKGKWPEIAENSGVGYEWLRKFMQDAIEDPGFRKVTKLYEYLKKDQLAA